MFLAVDAQYDRSDATVAGVVFETLSDTTPHRELTADLTGVAAYEPGSFYLRELPCILAVLELFTEQPDTIIIDGYVDLGQKPGLGRRLFETLDHKVSVIGVAKSPYPGAIASLVFRGRSARPLFVTAAGIDLNYAATFIERMHGNHRIPTMLKRADHLARGLPLTRP